MTQAQLLAQTLQKVRDLTMWYIGMLKLSDPYKEFEVNGVKLNSVYWLTAHLAWAENMLVLEMCGKDSVKADWLNHYALGSDGTLHTEKPDMKETIHLLKEIHAESMELLTNLPDEKLEEINKREFGFGGDKTVRMMIQHCIRHEAMHTGHLSWLCKINGVKAI